jgi:ABC-type multidrug transport system fused ATPase/permease subunit
MIDEATANVDTETDNQIQQASIAQWANRGGVRDFPNCGS